MLVLILVASRVRVWIEPLLHRVFHIETGDQLQALHTRLANKPTHSASVRHLLITCAAEIYPALEHILRACTNLVDLGIWVSSAHKTPGVFPDLARNILQGTIQVPSLARLSLALEDLIGDNHRVLAPDLTSFTSLTHLDLTNFGPPGSAALLQLLKRPDVLPSLHYLAIPDTDIELYLAILALPRRLRILCVYGETTVDDSESALAEAQIPDPRFCIVSSAGDFGAFSEDWVQAAWHGVGLWERAEDRVASRRRKALEAGRMVLYKNLQLNN
ncbi:hypothetical protein HMN09_00860400 [Mycena chlorophos]|uniref:Uncharacterized protein n=1 Tax=Mycena chlorophos TaxID=658473 RepID=A0A8H6W4F9_MYCCL|nr:hypothetical protein HMN09_00860400 [Mycena chlorophos]